MFNDLLRKILNTRDDTGRFSLADIQKNRLMALLSYLWLGWLVPMCAAKDSPYALYHSRQGMLLCIAETLLVLVLRILGYIPILGILFRIARVMVIIVAVLLSLLGIYNCYQGRARELPGMNLLMDLLSRVAGKR